jgi:hypothetical protein
MMKGPFPLNAVVTKSFNAVPGCGSDDEISIEEGDLVVIQGPDERCPEDWFKGFVRMRDSQFWKNPRVGINVLLSCLRCSLTSSAGLS